jgi:hypothetical protein
VIREAIEKILDLHSTRIVTAHGRAYTPDELKPLPSPMATPEPIKVHTLSGLVEYLREGERERPGGPLDEAHIESQRIVLIDGPESVRVISELEGEFRQRHAYIVATPFLPTQFPFGRYLDLETFVVGLQTGFVQDVYAQAVLKVVGNVRGDQVQTVEDDGVTQKVTASAGLTKVALVDVPNPVILRPYRTFQQIEQPASRYVLRVRRGGEGELPTAALHEVDDRGWKLEAIGAIEKYLRDHEVTAAVLA